jgi:hypothetical protein
MHFNKPLVGAVLGSIALLMASAASASVTIASFAQGYVSDKGDANGAADGGSAFAGMSAGDRYNAWAAFYIPTGVFSTADLSTVSSGVNIKEADWVAMYSVVTSYSVLQDYLGGVAAYDDLGAGSLYGLNLFVNGASSTSLGGTAVQDINAAAGSIFIIGFTNLTTNPLDIDGPDKGIFINAFQEGQPVLTLDAAPTTAVPEPATWAMMIAGFGLAGSALRRRRAVLAA